MALQLVEKNKRHGYFKIYQPNQMGYVNTQEFRGRKFNFFNNNRGCIFGKGITKNFAPNGEVVSDYTIEDIVEHFRSLGFTIEEYDSAGRRMNVPKKEEPKKVESKKEEIKETSKEE